MYHKFINSLVCVTAALCIAAPIAFAGEPAAKTRSATEFMGEGVGAMQGSDHPDKRMSAPSDRPSRQSILQSLKEETGVGAMQGRDIPGKHVPAVSDTPAQPSTLQSLKEETGIGAMQGK